MATTLQEFSDKLDRLGRDGVAQLLGEGRKDDSGDDTDGAKLDVAGIERSLLPEILPSASVAGGLTRVAAEATGSCGGGLGEPHRCIQQDGSECTWSCDTHAGKPQSQRQPATNHCGL